jgi:hypothetical protein
MSERKLHPLPEEGTRAGEFFDNQITVIPASKEEFLQIVRNQKPTETDENILQAKGFNFDKDGHIIVLVRTDVFPEKYMPYLETHEKWEAYMARKPGFNLLKKSVNDYVKDKKIDLSTYPNFSDFYRDIGVYNYDFRHEFAIYKEYQQAMADGRLDEYHNWFMNLREQEKPKANSLNLELIENDTKIRNSIYNKLTRNFQHRFTRK